MDVKTAAERAEVSTKLIYKLCKQNRIKHRRLGEKPGSGAIRISEQAFEEWLKSREVCTEAS